MKRIITAVFATASALVLLFTYKTSLEVVTPGAADTSAATTTSSADSGTDASSGADASTGSGSAASSSPDTSSGFGSDASSVAGSSSRTDPGTGTDSSTDTGSDSSTGSGSGSTASGSGSGLVDGTYTGTAVNTRYGAVQVAVTVSGGVITDVQVPQYPVRDRKDQQINSVAVPELVQETLSAQSADIQMISGATYTSEGYVQSLQSALDQAAS